jgi:hypothetical protein
MGATPQPVYVFCWYIHFFALSYETQSQILVQKKRLGSLHVRTCEDHKSGYDGILVFKITYVGHMATPGGLMPLRMQAKTFLPESVIASQGLASFRI